MRIFDWLRETFRDHARDDICARLQSWGIGARLAERGRPEVIPGHGTWLIDIYKGPIHWVNVRGEMVEEGGDYCAVYWIEYIVPDLKLATRFLGLIAKWSRERRRWEGNEWSLDVTALLNGDLRLREQLRSVDTDLEIRGYPSLKCWVLSIMTESRVPPLPSRDLWNCLQSVIGHLPIEPPPPLLFI